MLAKIVMAPHAPWSADRKPVEAYAEPPLFAGQPAERRAGQAAEQAAKT